MKKIFRNSLFSAAIAAAAALLPTSLAAQEGGEHVQTQIPQSPAIQQPAAAAPSNAQGDAHAAKADSGDAVQEEGHGHSAHAHDGHDAHHHGEEVFLFGKSLGPAAQFLLKLFNVLIFGGLLFWMVKGALGAAFRARAAEIETKLAQSEKDRAEGEAQVRELEAKMAGLQLELGGIMAKAEADAEAEKQRILEAARLEAEQILSTARSEIEYQRRLAETELRGLIANLAVEGAEKRIQQQMQGESVARVMDRAIEQIGGAD